MASPPPSIPPSLPDPSLDRVTAPAPASEPLIHHAGRDRPRRYRVLLLLDWYTRAYHSGVGRFAREAGWVLDATSVHNGIEESIRYWRGDGALVMLEKRNPTGSFCTSAGIPVVDMAYQYPDIELPRVLHDNEALGRLAAEHFLERGFENFAFCANRYWAWSEKERFAGFAGHLAKHGYQPTLLRWRPRGSQLNVRALRQAMARKLKRLKTPAAVMAHNDEVGVYLIDACIDADLLVPEEIAIVGCDNDELVCEFTPTPLSSVDADLERQGYEAASLLHRLMEGRDVPPLPIRIPPKGVTVRMSSDIFAVEHIGVAKALRFIWQNYTNPAIGVPDVVLASGVSKTALNRAFRQHLGRSVSKEILRVRLQRAISLLTQTDTPIHRIAAHCGFADAKHFRTSIKRETGLTPRAHRRQHPPG